MKSILKTIAALSAALSVLACQGTKEILTVPDGPEEVIQQEKTGNLVHITFKANSDETRTTLDEDGKSVVFKDGENVLVFDEYYNCKFTVSGSGKTVDISGEVHEDAEVFYALTPYNETVDFEYGDDALTTIVAETSLPHEQKAVDGTFEDGINIAAAMSTDKSSFSFQNVLSYAKMTLDATNLGGKKIQSILLESNYPLAGDCIVTFGDKCSVAPGTNTKKYVSISTDDADGMADGTYFMTVLPNAGGAITLIFTATDGSVATKTATLSKPFSAGTIKNLGTVKGLEWEEPQTEITVPEGTVLWADNFGEEGNNETDFDKALSLSNYQYSGRSGYGDNSTNVLFTPSGSVKLSKSDASNIKDGNIWLKKSADGSITTSSIKLYGVTSLVFSYSQSGGNNSATLTSAYYSINGSSWEALGSTSYTSKKEYSFTVPSGTASILLRVSHSSSNEYNTRIDNLQLIAASDGSYSGDVEANVITDEATDITEYSAVLNAEFDGAKFAPREAGFEWGTSKSEVEAGIGEVQQCETAPASTNGSFSVGIDGLGNGITYYYRAYILVWENGKGIYYYGDVKSFKTTSEAVIPAGDQPGWYELPVMDPETVIIGENSYLRSATDDNLYYAYHLCAGNETGPEGKTARNYTVCFSANDHVPLWVAAPRHSMYVGNSGRSKYSQDDNIPSIYQYTSTDTGGGCNKGHMLGSAERTSSSATNKQVFFFSNIAPQLSSGFNTGGGGWNLLEDWVDTKVCADTLYEVVGAYFDNYSDTKGYGYSVQAKKISFGGRTDVSFPTMFYYVLLRTKNGNTGKAIDACSADELMCAAFVRSHTNSLKGQAVTKTEMMSVSDLEKITGFTYFANLSDQQKSIKNSFNPSDWGL